MFFGSSLVVGRGSEAIYYEINCLRKAPNLTKNKHVKIEHLYYRIWSYSFFFIEISLLSSNKKIYVMYK